MQLIAVSTLSLRLMKKAILLLICLTPLLCSLSFGQKIFWQGDLITFTKMDNADFTMASNQDRITDSVWITRKATSSIYNIRLESAYIATSPAKTLWAYGTTQDISTLTFKTWDETHGSKPQSAVGKEMVVFLEDDSIYLDLKFSSFSGGGPGGGFSYQRSTNLARISLNETPCGIYTSPSGKVYTQNASFMDTVYGSKGTNSIFAIKLTFSSLDVTFTRGGNQFTANESAATYQWMDCSSGFTPIPNETNQQFIATTTGNYAVEVTKNACKDTSICYNHASLSAGFPLELTEVSLYPNPAQNSVNINLGTIYKQATISLYSVTGTLLARQAITNADKATLPILQPQGIYFIEIEVNSGIKTRLKLIVE